MDSKSSVPKELKRALIVASAGSIAVALATVGYGIPAPHALAIVSIAGLCAAVSTAVGLVLLYLARRRSVGGQVCLIVSFMLVGAVLGTWAIAQAMFVNKHDLGVLIVVLMTAAVAMSIGALALGARISRSADEVLRVVRRFEGLPSNSIQDHPEEFARMESELRNMNQRLQDENERIASLEASRQGLISWVSSDLHDGIAEIERLISTGSSASGDLSSAVKRMRDLVDDLVELHHRR